MCSASYYEVRNLLFKMSFCNGKVVPSASQNVHQTFPYISATHYGFGISFLLHNFPNRGILSYADPSAFPDIGSVWSKLIAFCGRERLSQHQVAAFPMAVALRASNGTYRLMQNLVPLNVALKILRTSVEKVSYVERTGEGRQARYTLRLS